MFKKYFNIVVAVFLFLLVSSVAFALDFGEEKFGIGYQGTWPVSGISGIMDVTDEISAQVILGPFGDLKTYAARGIYRFRKEDNWNAYGYGMLGAWSYTGLEIGTGFRLQETTETAIGFGAGAGIEYDWRAWFDDFPPIWWNIELGLARVNFDKIDYSFNSFMFGGGLHYRF